MTTAALHLDHVWKRYRLGQATGIRGLFGGRDRGTFWSLRDLSLRIGPGESVGLVGHNGAGKTTTLKLLAGITRPTRGKVATRGRVASLINLGAGFHRELTGRENVYLNGIILGLTRREVRERFDAIVDFADVGGYIDTPVKHYSTGMYARLGFAVAAHVDPDILLVDEVLSVGDVEFQDRSIRKMLSFRDRGCGIVFVSHNLSAIEMMCQRAVWLDHGVPRLEGSATDVVRAYLDAVDEELVAAAGVRAGDATGAASVLVQRVTTCAADGRAGTDFEHGAALVVRLECVAPTGATGVTVAVTIRGDYGPLMTASSDEAGPPIRWAAGRHVLECRFDTLPLLPGLYRVEVLVKQDGGSLPDMPESRAAFRVNTDLGEFGSTSPVGVTKSRGGFLAVPYSWRLETAAGVAEIPGLARPAELRRPADGRSGEGDADFLGEL